MNKNDEIFLAQKIRAQYTEKQTSGLDELKKLDAQAKRPANLFAYIFGSIGAIIMGAGMSLVMTDLAHILNIAHPMLWGIVIGIVGLVMVSINYPLHKAILNSRRKKYADKILCLSDEILKR